MTDLRADPPSPGSPGDDRATDDAPAADPSRPDHQAPGWAPRRDLTVGTLAAVVVFAVLVARNWWVLQGPVNLGGDEGHQFATAWDAITMRELRGNGSRIGFHHPGPAYEYIWGAADVVRRVLGSPVEQQNAQMLGGFALNAAQLGAIVAIVRSHLGTVVRGALVVAAVAGLAYLEPGIMAGPWLPHMFFASFTLMVVAGASAAAGRLPSLVAFVAGAGLLVQGHIAFSTFAGVAVVAVTLALWRTGGLRRLWSDERPTLYATAGLAAAFVTPMVIYTLTDWPGELGRYWQFVRQEGGGHPLGDAGRFVLQFWPGDAPRWQALALLGSLGLLAVVSSWRRSRFGAFLLGAIVLMELCLLNYAANGVDDLAGGRYVALWIVALPGLAVGTAVALALPDRVVDPAPLAGRVAVAGVTAAVVAVAAFSPSTRFDPFEFSMVPDLVDQMEATADGRPLVLDADLEELGPYYLAPAIVAEAEDEGLRVCFTDPAWEIKFSDRRTCTAAELRDGERYTLYPLEGVPPEVAAQQPPAYHTAWVYNGVDPGE